MLVGDAAPWLDRFVSFDNRFLERIAVVWSSCLAVLPGQPEEDAITINSVHHLSKDSVVRGLCYWVEYQYEPFGTAADGSRYSKGKIDIAVLFDWERNRYLAYECKRLGVIQADGRRSLATDYVTEGMMRFMTEQYAEGLPLGCMLGFVMDGDIEFALDRVTASIEGHRPLGLIKGLTTVPPLQAIQRFVTRHLRPAGTQVELRHALLSYRSTR